MSTALVPLNCPRKEQRTAAGCKTRAAHKSATARLEMGVGQIKPPGIGPQLLVLPFTRATQFWGCPIFDHHSPLFFFKGVSFWGTCNEAGPFQPLDPVAQNNRSAKAKSRASRWPTVVASLRL